MLEDLGWDAQVRIWVDSATAKSVASRVGLGKMRHMEVNFLWLQQAARDGRVVLKKVPRQPNPTGILTKPLGREDMANKMARVGGRIVRQ